MGFIFTPPLVYLPTCTLTFDDTIIGGEERNGFIVTSDRCVGFFEGMEYNLNQRTFKEGE